MRKVMSLRVPIDTLLWHSKDANIDTAPLLLDGIKMSRADDIIHRMTILVGQHQAQLVLRTAYSVWPHHQRS